MNESAQPSLARLEIAPQKKLRRKGGPTIILVAVTIAVLAAVAVFVVARKSGQKTVPAQVASAASASATPTVPVSPPKPGDVVLTVSGYVIPRERIEISPKFLGTVKSIAVKKGDRVHKGDVIVELEDDEYRARILEAQGRLALAEANFSNAEVNLKRQLNLAHENVDSQRALDDARRSRDAAAAEITVAEGQLTLQQTYRDWCTIRAPIDGIILEKLVDPNELVVPQSFGGSRGPSTAFVAMADLNDLQVEIDLNEADTPKVHLQQRCRVSPEAYPDKKYDGFVAEVAPEANRSKGTLQVKVQIEKPDRYLTPELTAKVDFLAD